jgi:hypothetical protein
MHQLMHQFDASFSESDASFSESDASNWCIEKAGVLPESSEQKAKLESENLAKRSKGTWRSARAFFRFWENWPTKKLGTKSQLV